MEAASGKARRRTQPVLACRAVIEGEGDWREAAVSVPCQECYRPGPAQSAGRDGPNRRGLGKRWAMARMPVTAGATRLQVIARTPSSPARLCQLKPNVPRPLGSGGLTPCRRRHFHEEPW